MAKDWYGLKVGDEVIYRGDQGKVIELFDRDKNGGVMRTANGREYIIVCRLCSKVEKETIQYCPKCLLEGVKAEIIENTLLKRCVKCMTDYKFEIKEGKIEQPIKGMKALLG